MRLFITLCAFLAYLATVYCQEDNFKCPDEFEGFYPHLYSCDKYWHCRSGKAHLKLCGNGLAFDDSDKSFNTENCDYIHSVDCGTRTILEPPISAPNCPRLFGTFPDPADCTSFINCRAGLFNKYSCAPGLAFDPEDRVCKWADQVSACKGSPDTEEQEESGKFKCPTGGPIGIFTKHAHPEDCRQYYVCISGTPREYGCPLGTVFKVGLTDTDGKCSDPEDVPECSNYYGSLAFDKQDLVKAGVDPEAVGAEVTAAPSASRIPLPRASVPTTSPVRLQPIPRIPEENDEVEFDTELRIQDLPKPQINNPDRANIRQRPKDTARFETNPVRQQPIPSILEENDDVEFDTELKIQDLPKPQSSNPDRDNIRQRPRPTTRLETNGSPRPTRPSLAEPAIETTTLTNKLPAALVSAGLEENSDSSPVFDQNRGVIVNSSPKNAPGATLKSSESKKPDKVKSGDDYYYYYYYYDEDEDKKSTNESS